MRKLLCLLPVLLATDVAPSIQAIDCELLSSNGLFANNTETYEIVNTGGVLKAGHTYKYQCPPGHILQGVLHDVCVNGKLLSVTNKNPPSCVNACSRDALKRMTSRGTCKYNNTFIDCNGDIFLPGTTMKYLCYISPNYQENSVTCQETGEWDIVAYPCYPDCGGFHEHENKFNMTRIPWQADIYRRNTVGQYEHVCGGSIITPKLIVTAAHCLWDHNLSKMMDLSLFSVSVGKTRRDYYEVDKDYGPQFFKISEYQIGRFF